MISRNAFATDGGYCTPKISDNTTQSSWQIIVLLLALAILAEVIMFDVGMMLYLMISRSFCHLKTTDVQVCSELMSTSGLSGILFLVSFFLIKDDSSSVPLLLTSFGTVAEQLHCTHVNIVV